MANNTDPNTSSESNLNQSNLFAGGIESAGVKKGVHWRKLESSNGWVNITVFETGCIDVQVLVACAVNPAVEYIEVLAAELPAVTNLLIDKAKAAGEMARFDQSALDISNEMQKKLDATRRRQRLVGVPAA